MKHEFGFKIGAMTFTALPVLKAKLIDIFKLIVLCYSVVVMFCSNSENKQNVVIFLKNFAFGFTEPIGQSWHSTDIWLGGA